ncbi:hypothetical protein [Nostoc sp. 'Peltigera membranacea cyanobiont' 210A]|uniref:hypothetical protein n=1 Tax=Nostoc sp. 'Peltigera membranacea cyanobiont' 210A TaxID=2014529 RepID=UPI00167E1915|nr:hypothetical protein [Nostoc sp. 'Peltigera membranacea cyanobiont' 210A]
MLLARRSPEQPLQLAEFDKQVALEALCQGQTSFLVRCLRRATPTHSRSLTPKPQTL